MWKKPVGFRWVLLAVLLGHSALFGLVWLSGARHDMHGIMGYMLESAPLGCFPVLLFAPEDFHDFLIMAYVVGWVNWVVLAFVAYLWYQSHVDTKSKE
jgi:hypothetical protein